MFTNAFCCSPFTERTTDIVVDRCHWRFPQFLRPRGILSEIKKKKKYNGSGGLTCSRRPWCVEITRLVKRCMWFTRRQRPVRALFTTAIVLCAITAKRALIRRRYTMCSTETVPRRDTTARENHCRRLKRTTTDRLSVNQPLWWCWAQADLLWWRSARPRADVILRRAYTCTSRVLFSVQARRPSRFSALVGPPPNRLSKWKHPTLRIYYLYVHICHDIVVYTVVGENRLKRSTASEHAYFILFCFSFVDVSN